MDSGSQWIIEKSLETQKTKPFESKSWLLTGLSMFPNDFNLKFLTYELCKRDGTATEASQQLLSMCRNNAFNVQEKFKAEIRTLVISIQADTKTEQDIFNTDIFEKLTDDVQCSILKDAATHADTVLSKCSILLALVRRFPHLSRDYGSTLIASLFEAELKESPNTPLNDYRTYFVSEVLPMILRDSPGSDRKILLNLLDKAIQYLAIVAFYPDLKGVYSKNTTLIPQPFVQMGELLLHTGRYVKWSTNPNVYKDTKTIIQHAQYLHNRLGDEYSKTLRKEFVYHCTFAILRLVSQVNDCIRSHTDLFLAQQKFTAPKPVSLKRARKDPTSPATDLMVCDSVSAGEDLKSAFLGACTIFDLLNTDSGYMKLYHELMDRLDSERWQSCLSRFSTFRLLYKHDYVALLGASGSGVTGSTPGWSTQIILSATCSTALADYKDACTKITGVLEALTIAPGPQPEISGTTFLFVNTQAEIFSVCLRMLVYIIKEGSLTQKQISDTQLAFLLILCQAHWDENQELFNQIISKIKERKTFTYVDFFKYIINVDILEMMCYLQTEQGGSVKLEVIPLSAERIAKQRTVTRGVKRDAEEDLKSAFITQVSRSRENVAQLLVQFIKENKSEIIHGAKQ